MIVPVMSKTIMIIGGGISGLALLHYLSQRHARRPDINIRLLEKEGRAGGTIRTVDAHGCLFETGPNGFLDSKQRTLDFVEDLGLSAEIVKAGAQSKIRYISVGDSLHALPSGPKSFLTFPPLTLFDKLRVLGEVFVPKGLDPDESVYAFGKRRLGEKFARIFLDPMISGIYGGDADRINLRAAFPRIYQLEQEFGSLFKAMMGLRKQKKTRRVASTRAPDLNQDRFRAVHRIRKDGMSPRGSTGMPMGTLTSFRQGQTRFVDALARRYETNIRFRQEVKTVSHHQGRFIISSGDQQHEADELFISTPAYHAADILQEISPPLAEELNRVEYAPIAVVGLVFSLSVFQNPPKGFGYVIPSSEKKDVLGVLFESNIFPERCPDGRILFRVMAGGARHPGILEKSQEEIVRLAAHEVQKTFLIAADPLRTMFAAWPKAIPQYTRNYFDIQNGLDEELKNWNRLHLVANYRGGVSLNDCIENAYQAAQKSCLLKN